MVRAIVGANWGDEGKGKLTDYMAAQSDFVVRFQGGSNAGHTVINNYGKFALHLLPSGVFHPHVTNVLGPGTAVNIGILLNELKHLERQNVPRPKLLISERAQIVMPWHLLFDRLEEQRLGSSNFGSTQAGIAPFYSDKYAKTGIQVTDIYYPVTLKEKIFAACEVKNAILKSLYTGSTDALSGLETYCLDPRRIYEEISALGVEIQSMVCDTTRLLHDAAGKGRNILLEGQLGALRDPDHGIYPFSTSSSPLAGFAAVGAGIPPREINDVTAVVKAYSSCVGAGPFVSEVFGDEASQLRERGGDAGEYGATTGRPRRMGWFDAVATRYGCMVQGATEAALTLLDVLGYLEEIPVCTGYDTGGRITGDFPVTQQLYEAKPVYTVLPGWKCDISGIRSFNALPPEAKDYVRFVENEIRVPVKWISNGPRREDLIMMQP